jgi:hypothetical protein
MLVRFMRRAKSSGAGVVHFVPISVEAHCVASVDYDTDTTSNIEFRSGRNNSLRFITVEGAHAEIERLVNDAKAKPPVFGEPFVHTGSLTA